MIVFARQWQLRHRRRVESQQVVSFRIHWWFSFSVLSSSVLAKRQLKGPRSRQTNSRLFECRSVLTTLCKQWHSRPSDKTWVGGVDNIIVFLFWFLCGLRRIRAGGESVGVGFSSRQPTPLWDTAFPRGSYSLERNGDSLSLGLDLQFVSACQE